MTEIKYGALTGIKSANVFSCTLPEIKDDELLLKVEMCNICTFDYQRWLGLRECKFPFSDGHEYTGIIVKKGKSVIDEFKIGDRVGKLYNYCGICENCRSGRTGDCQYRPPETPDENGFYGQKAFANYKIIPQRLAIKISNELNPEEAAFLEPVSTVVHGLKKLAIQPCQNVVIVGAGTMGIVNAQVAKTYGANIIMCDLSEKKIKRAMSMGLGPVIDSKNQNPVEEVFKLTNGVGADVVIVSVGNTIAYKQGYEMLRKHRGKMLFFPANFPKPEFQCDPNEIHYRKIELIGTVDADVCDFVQASKLLSSRKIDVSFALEGKIIGLKDFQKAMEAAATLDSYRVSVDCQDI